MRIQTPINNYGNYNRSSHNTKFQTSFKGMSITLVVLAAREGINGIKGYKCVKYIEELQRQLNSNEPDRFIIGVNALSKTPDTFFDSEHGKWIDWADTFTCFRSRGQELRYIPELRFSALQNIDCISDTSYTNIQTKKEFINTFFDNGHEISNILVEKFSRLKDSIYSTFKVEVLDKLFSSHRYNNIRQRRLDINTCSSQLFNYDISSSPCQESAFPGHLNRNLEIAYNNLTMLATLDKNIYKGYYSRIRPLIERAKNILKQYTYDSPRDHSTNFHELMCADYEILKTL